MDPGANIEIVPMVSSGIVKINGINPNTHILHLKMIVIGLLAVNGDHLGQKKFLRTI